MSRIPLKILLVEDNPSDVFFVRQALGYEGIQSDLVVARDGEQAIAFVEAAEAKQRPPCPELILLDLNLPRTSGTEFLRWLRQSSRCPEVPVIVVTSSDSPDDKAEATGLGISRYFLKPHNLDEYMKLGSVVKQVCEAASDIH